MKRNQTGQDPEKEKERIKYRGGVFDGFVENREKD